MSATVPPTKPPEPEKPASPEDDVQLSLWGHLGELRDRLRKATIAALVGIVVAYNFSDVIYRWLMDPVYAALPEGQRYMIFTSLVEPLFVYIKIACYAGLFVAAPFILYQIWGFIAPGLYRNERRMVIPFVGLGSLFFVGGALFARYLILPYAFEYLVKGFQFDGLRAMPSMGEQLTLVLALVLAFAVIFEMPLIITLLARLGIVKAAWFAKYRRHAAVVNLVLAAIITPTGDPFNLALMAVPMIVCYELGIVGARLMEKKPEPDPAAKAAAEGAKPA